MSANIRFWGIYIIAYIGFSSLTTLSAQSSCRAQDSLVLLSFAKNTFIDDWTIKWDINSPMDTWHGISLSAEGCVECIDMDGEDDCRISVSFGNGLHGSLDPALARLGSLKRLLLGNNRISGEIPREIFEMDQLEIFDVFANEMIGPLPANMGNAGNLVIISVSGNNLTGMIPPSVGNLKNLTDLYADNNQIIGPLPSSLGNATELEKIRLHKNKIQGTIPRELGNLPKLKSLNLAQNQLSGAIPTTIGQLKLMEDLVLESNQLSGNIPPEIGNCSKLKRIRICHNQIIGPLPLTIENLTTLVLLHANDNQLSGSIPSEIGACLMLNDLQLDHNELSGEIPKELGYCGNMRKMNLSFNNIIGPLPRTVQNMKQLTDLLATDNNLSGPLPEEVADMTSLRTLRAQNNNIIGPLPSRVDELESLQEMHLENNKIDGEIPNAYGLAPRLNKLMLKNNRLEGCFPPSLIDDCDKEFNFTENNKLPWLGDLQMFCDGNEQIGAPCSADPNIPEQEIQPNCECLKFVCAPVTVVMDAFLCANEVLTLGSGSYSEAGTITDTLMSTYGCDSIIMVNIATMELEITTDEAQCSNESSGSAKISSNWNGTYDYLVSDAQGTTVLSATAQTTLPELNNSLEPGLYRMQLKEVDMECSIDTFFEIKALFEPASESYIQGIQCKGQSYTVNGVTYDENNLSGTELLQTIHGCDSTIIIDLAYAQLGVQSENLNCEGEDNGSIVGAMSLVGNYKVTIYDDAGVMVHEESTTQNFGTDPILKTGSYTVSVLATDQGCDYTDAVTITAQNAVPEPVMLEQVLCEDEEIILNGVVYSQDRPEGTETLVSKGGCDSVVLIALKYLELEAATEHTQCDNDETGLISGKMSESGTYIVTIENASGNVVYDTSTDQNFTTDASLKAGSYLLEIISDDNGCQYIETLTIESENTTPEPVLLDKVLCSDEELTINGQVYSQDNLSGTELLSSAAGCDSVVNISLQYFDEPMAQDDSYNAGNDTEIKFDVLENDDVENRQNVNINIISEDKIESVEVESNELVIQLDRNYSGTSLVEYELCHNDCIELCTRAILTITSQHEGYDEDILTPNGDGYNDMLVVKGYDEYEQIPNAKINVVNRWGQVVFASEDYHNDWKGTFQGQSDKALPEGVYYYHLIYDNGSSNMGSRSLIR